MYWVRLTKSTESEPGLRVFNVLFQVPMELLLTLWMAHADPGTSSSQLSARLICTYLL